MRRLGGWLALMGTLAVSACAPAGSGTPPSATGLPTAKPADRQEPTPAPGVPSTPVPTIDPGSSLGGGAQAAVDAALRDAESHLGLNPGTVRVEQVEARQWPDRSLGCPRPGVLYAQVITPGFLVLVSGGGKQLEYHADDRGQVVLCHER